MFSKTFFYNMQSNLLDKIVWLTWSDCQVKKLSKITCMKCINFQKTDIEDAKKIQVLGVSIKLAGDGQFDSRGKINSPTIAF